MSFSNFKDFCKELIEIGGFYEVHPIILIIEEIIRKDDDFLNDEFGDFSYNIKEAIEEEHLDSYDSSANYYTQAQEGIKDKIPYSKKSEAKNFSKKKFQK